MATSGTLTRPATLTDVDETTGQRIKRLRKDLGWTQKQLAEAAEPPLTVETVSNVERDRETATGERPSVSLLLAALERERQRRQGENGPRPSRQLIEFLLDSGEDVRVRRIGRNRKTRIITVAVPDEDATAEQIAQDLEDFHREQRRGDAPNG